MQNRERTSAVPEIEAAKSDFLSALLAPGDEHSPFDGLPKDRRLEAGSLVKGKEKELRALVREMFGFIGEVIRPQNQVFVPKRYRDVDEVEGTTFCRAVISLAKDRGKIHRYQLWVTEKALIEVEGPALRADRIDGRILGEMERLHSAFIETSKKDVHEAAMMRKKTLEDLIRLATRQIEVATVTFQRFRIEDHRPAYEPLLGIRFISCIAGSQAYPVIFAGKNDVVCFQMPLLAQTTAFPVDDCLGKGEILGLVDEQVLENSGLKKVFNLVCDRALNDPEKADGRKLLKR